MKKTFIFIILVLMVSFSGFVHALIVQDPNGAYDIEIELYEGWNMIAGTIPDGGISQDSEIQLSDIRAMWYYSPFQKEYLEVHPNTDWTNINKDDEDFALTTAMWIYTKKSGTIKYNTLEDYPPLENRQLIGGWNFVTITPDMYSGILDGAGYDYEFFIWDRVAENCNLESINFWNPEIQDWVMVESDLNFGEEINDFMGYGMVVKVTNDCNLTTPSGNTDGPPGLPGGDFSYIVENVRDVEFLQSSIESLPCVLHPSKTCLRYIGKYGYEGELEVIVEINDDELVTEEYSQYIENTLSEGTLSSGDWLGYHYYVYVLGDDLLISWISGDKIIFIEQEPYDDSLPNDHLEDLLTSYLNKYPSELNLF